MLRKSTAPEWLAWYLIFNALGVIASQLTGFWQTLLIIITGKVILIIFHLLLFENLAQLVTLSGIVSRMEFICWLSHDW